MAVSISGEGVISGSSSYSFDSNLSIEGDITSAEFIGIITAQSGIRVTGGSVGIGTTDPGSHKLHLYGATNSDIRMTATGDDIINIFANSNRSSANDSLFAIKGEWNGTQVGNIKINAGDDTTNKDDGYITFSTRESGASTAERLRITSDGKFGFNDNNPERTIDVQGANCMLQLEGTGGNGRQYSLCSTDDTTGPAVGPAGQFVIYDDTAGADRLTITSSGNIGIATTSPAQALDVVGRISKTEYEPGEIIEQISACCDGSAHTVKSGTYTMTNVTTSQTATTSDATASGSAITYTPPVGTKRIHYQYWFKWEASERSGLSHFFIDCDGSDVVPSRRTICSNLGYNSAGTSLYHHAEWWNCMSWVFECDAAATDVSEGQYAGWSANQEAKAIRVRFREYSGSYEIALHRNHYWDGATASGVNLAPIKPQLIVTAIA